MDIIEAVETLKKQGFIIVSGTQGILGRLNLPPKKLEELEEYVKEIEAVNRTGRAVLPKI